MSATPQPWFDLRNRLKAVEEQLRRLRNTSAFSGTGMHPNGNGGLDSDNFASGSTGFSLNGSTGAAEFTDIIILGVSVGADAPVEIGIARLYAEAFSLATSYAQKASASLTVPAGCTRLLAILNGTMYAVNQNTTGGSDTNGGDAIYVRATIQSNNTGGSPHGLTGWNGFTTATSNDTFQLTGLTPGGTVALGVEGKCGYQPIPSYVDNWIKATATLVWLR